MSIPLGHKLKIMKRIKDLRRERGMSVPESRQGGARPYVKDSLSTTDPNGAKRPGAKRTDLDELPDPTNGLYTSGTTLIETQHESQGIGRALNNHGGSLLNGEYDEAESHQQFLEALNAWRTGGPTMPKPRRTVVGAASSQGQEKKQVRFSNTNGAGALPESEAAENHIANPNRKESCWNCYKLFSMADVTAKTDPSTNKNFCGDACLQKHLMANQIACQYKDGTGARTCSRRFVKSLGHFLHGKWFCSHACAEKDPEAQKIKEMLERKDRGEDITEKYDLKLWIHPSQQCIIQFSNYIPNNMQIGVIEKVVDEEDEEDDEDGAENAGDIDL